MKQSGIIIIFLILLLLLLGADSYISYNAGKETEYKTVLVHDTITHVITENNNHYTKYIIHDAIPPLTKKDGDDIAIDYFSYHVISDSLIDSLIYVQLIDTLYKNDLKGRKFSYKILRPYESCTDYVYQNATSQSKFKLFAGGNVSYDTKFSLGLSLYGLTKKESLYGVGYDLLQKRFTISYGVKLHW